MCCLERKKHDMDYYFFTSACIWLFDYFTLTAQSPSQRRRISLNKTIIGIKHQLLKIYMASHRVYRIIWLLLSDQIALPFLSIKTDRPTLVPPTWEQELREELGKNIQYCDIQRCSLIPTDSFCKRFSPWFSSQNHLGMLSDMKWKRRAIGSY